MYDFSTYLLPFTKYIARSLYLCELDSAHSSPSWPSVILAVSFARFLTINFASSGLRSVIVCLRLNLK